MSERPQRRAWTAEDLAALRGETGVETGAPADREAVERDFGQLVHRPATAVLLPRTPEDVERIVAFANARTLTLTPRGRGMSQGGQSIPSGGVSLDLSRLVDVGSPGAGLSRAGSADPDEERTMWCGAGVTWRSAVAAAAPLGLMPKVVPLNLDLTVGGLLSVCGVGATSHRHGPAVARVAELDVVTGGGRRARCSATQDASLFFATLAGLGRASLIVAARLELRRFEPRVRTFYLLFDTIEAWLAAHESLIASGRADYLEGFCTPCVQGLRNGPRGRTPFAQWFYGLHVTVEHEPDRGPPPEQVLAGLPGHKLVHVEDADTVAFAARYDPRFAAMRTSGAWSLPHPWLEAMLPGERLAEILTAILELYPVALGDGPRLIFVDPRGAPPLLRMPSSPRVACCALLPVGIPAHLLSGTLDAFRAIHACIVQAGGKRVLSGWTTMMDDHSLREHFGQQLADTLPSTMAQHDPHGVLDSPITETSSSVYSRQGRSC